MRNQRDAIGHGFSWRHDLLPEGFDIVDVSDFFASGRKAKNPFEAPQVALTQAANRAEADLSSLAKPLQEFAEVPASDLPSTEETSDGDVDFAYAKPTDKGKGSGGGSNKGGKGKDKTDTSDGGGTTDGEGPDDGDDGTGDTGGSSGDGGTADGGTSDGGSSGDGTTRTIDYVSGLDTPDGFNIDVEFSGSWTDAMKQVLYNVVEEISDIVTGDVADAGDIDDFHLLALANEIDGSGGYLGVGGTLTERSGSFLPSEGYLRVDVADVENQMNIGTFEDVVFHEVLHAMGFGTIWQETGLVETIGDEQRFVGENAILAYASVFPDIAEADPYSDQGVPIASDGAHWDHGDFGHEIMTPSLYYSGNYASDMTIAALEDMGYETVFDDQNYAVA